MSAVDQAAPELHRLKIDAQPMSDLLSGNKTCEIRNDDRGFSVGDHVHLVCADGRETDRIISHIQRGYGLPDGLCVLSYRADLAAPSAPAEVEGLVRQAHAEFSDYFRCNYPGPDTIIHDPEWHAPKLFRAATQQFATALTAQQADIERLRNNTNRFPELMASILAAKAQALPERIAVIADAISALPEELGQYQWKADDRPVFGDKFVRTVVGDNGHGAGRQWIASTPPHIDGLAQYIAALIADYAAEKARAETAESERDALESALEEIATYDDGAGAGLAYTAKQALAKLKGDV